MTQKKPLNHNDAQGRDPPTAAAAAGAEEYKVGPGRPPKEHQFKPGVSGNPKGAKRKAPPIAVDLKVALERALDKKVQLKQGEREQTVSMAVAGIEQLVAQYALIAFGPWASILRGAGALRELIEGLPALRLHGVFSGKGLPATDRDIDISGFRLHGIGAPPGALGRRPPATAFR